MAAVTGIRWTIQEGYDLHVFGGGEPSRRLDEILVLELDDDTAVFATRPPPGVTVEFKAEFNGAPSAHGVTVNELTGTVSVSGATLSPPRLRNFLIRADVTDPNATQILDPAKIRVHVHGSISAVRLTPDPLTIRPGADGFRLTLLAEFDDGTLGDLTDLRGLAWTSADPDSVEVDPETGELKANVVGATVDITVTVSTGVGSHSATGTVKTAAPFGQAIELTWVNGKGRSTLRDAVNILFLPEGFDNSEKPQFESIVRKIVHTLRTNRMTRPFDLFKNSVNYWMAFIRSPQKGVSVLPECSRRLRPDFLAFKGRNVPLPTDPSTGAASWAPSELIHEVGLPLIADVVGRPLDGGTDPLLPDLQTLYGSKVTVARVARNFAWWQNTITSRILLNEIDTAFGLAQGERPRVNDRWESHYTGFNPRRTVLSFAFSHGPDLRNDLNAGFVTNVRNAFRDAGISLSKATLLSREPTTDPRWLVTDIDNGRVFSVRDEGQHFNIHERYSLAHFNTFLENLTVRSERVGNRWTTGKDHGLVCFIARTARRGGANFGSYYSISLGSEDEVDVLEAIEVTLGQTTHVVDPMPIPSKPGIGIVGVTAHETGHAAQFGNLGDEYSNFGRRRIPSTRASRLTSRGNLQAESELLVDPTQPQSGLDGNKIKWARNDAQEALWPRIAAAGVLKEKPSPIGAVDPSFGNHRTFEITLERSHGKPFGELDLEWVSAFLRRRPLLSNPILTGPMSIRRVTRDTIEVHLYANATINVDPDDFPAGSILLVPAREEVPPPALGRPLPIVSPFIRDHITTTRKPLRSSRDAQGQCVHPDPILSRKPDNLPAGIKGPRFHAWITGLYEGGDTYSCGVYHSTGVCLMRWSREIKDAPKYIYQFCHVCQYIMVDGIDPTQHRTIDKDYEKKVPQLGP